MDCGLGILQRRFNKGGCDIKRRLWICWLDCGLWNGSWIVVCGMDRGLWIADLAKEVVI